MNIDQLRFLVVEDQGFQRWVTGNILEKMGAKQVVTAVDGRSALEALAEMDRPIDIIVSDLDMPGMDGMEFIRNIGENWRAASLIVLSSLDGVVVRSVESMAIAYGVRLLGAIDKPATEKKLHALIDRHEPPIEPLAPAAPMHLGWSEIEEGLKKGQFEAFFQPKVEVSTGRLRGAEANARWRHPGKGLIAPSVFMDAMESSGLVEELTASIARSAVRNCRIWQNAGLDVPVAVNLSLTSLSDTSLADRMVAVVVAQDLHPRSVTFEVTESAAANDAGRVLENLSRLRMKGFGLSIDDFGTGYSSMERLSQCPFTELKIDQRFVRSAGSEASSLAVLESCLEIAKKLGIVAVAEGVENEAQWRLLRDLECPQAQGFYIAKPMESGAFLEWAHIRHKVRA